MQNKSKAGIYAALLSINNHIEALKRVAQIQNRNYGVKRLPSDLIDSAKARDILVDLLDCPSLESDSIKWGFEGGCNFTTSKLLVTAINMAYNELFQAWRRRNDTRLQLFNSPLPGDMDEVVYIPAEFNVYTPILKVAESIYAYTMSLVHEQRDKYGWLVYINNNNSGMENYTRLASDYPLWAIERASEIGDPIKTILYYQSAEEINDIWNPPGKEESINNIRSWLFGKRDANDTSRHQEIVDLVANRHFRRFIKYFNKGTSDSILKTVDYLYLIAASPEFHREKSIFLSQYTIAGHLGIADIFDISLEDDYLRNHDCSQGSCIDSIRRRASYRYKSYSTQDSADLGGLIESIRAIRIEKSH